MVYDALNRAVTITLGNSATARSVYNNAGWLTTLRNAKSDGTILSVFTYTYDNVGNRMSVADANRAASVSERRMVPLAHARGSVLT